MSAGQTQLQDSFDPVRETARARIKVLDRAGGGKEFLLPALRNFREKIAITFFWVFLTFCLLEFGFFTRLASQMFPGVIRFFIINHLGYFLLILALFELVLTIAGLDVWLRSSRIVATRGELQVVTHWLFFKRTIRAFASDIIEITASNNTTVNATRYYDLIVRTRGQGKGWLARNFPPKPEASAAFSPADLEVFNTGGRKFAAAANIEGEPEAQWLLGQLRAALGMA